MDGQVEQSKVAEPLGDLQPGADGPDLAVVRLDLFL